MGAVKALTDERMLTKHNAISRWGINCSFVPSIN